MIGSPAQWSVPVTSATFSVRTAVPDRLLGTGALETSRAEPGDRDVQFGPVADPDVAAAALDLSVAGSHRSERGAPARSRFSSPLRGRSSRFWSGCCAGRRSGRSEDWPRAVRRFGGRYVRIGLSARRCRADALLDPATSRHTVCCRLRRSYTTTGRHERVPEERADSVTRPPRTSPHVGDHDEASTRHRTRSSASIAVITSPGATPRYSERIDNLTSRASENSSHPLYSDPYEE